MLSVVRLESDAETEKALRARLMGTLKEGEMTRRGVSVRLLFVIVFLSACVPTPAVIIQEVPQTVIVMATVAPPTITATLELSPTPSATALPTPIQTPRFDALVTGDVLNLRSEPDIDSQAIGALEKGCELQVIGRTGEGDWLKVEFQGIEGWVAAPYVELSIPLDTIPIVAGVPGPPRGTAPIPPEHGVSAEVLRVIDGGTIEVSINGETYKVRYIGIEIPETKHPERPGEWMGPEAATQNEKLVGGKTVILEKDVLERDEHGRLLRYVWVGDLMVNVELVRLGYVEVSTYPPHVIYQDLFLQLQQEAREAGRGLWGAHTATPEATHTVTPSATIPRPPLCPNPNARLTYPTQDAKLEGVAEIRGSADINNFWYYKLEFRAEGEDEWAFLERFDKPVTDGVLGHWNTTTLPDGFYVFRLVVVDNTGNYPAPCEVQVLVEH